MENASFWSHLKLRYIWHAYPKFDTQFNIYT